MWFVNEEIVRRPKAVIVNGIRYSKKVFYKTKEELESIGIRIISEGSTPDNRYYTFVEELVGTVDGLTLNRNPVEIGLNIIQNRMLADLKEDYEKIVKRYPKVETSLGFTVDGSAENLQALKLGKKYQNTKVVAVDGSVHNINPVTDYDKIIEAIEMNYVKLHQQRQEKVQIILGFESIQECIEYENTEYDSVEEILEMSDSGDFDPTGQTQTIVRTKNLLFEWEPYKVGDIGNEFDLDLLHKRATYAMVKLDVYKSLDKVNKDVNGAVTAIAGGEALNLDVYIKTSNNSNGRTYYSYEEKRGAKYLKDMIIFMVALDFIQKQDEEFSLAVLENREPNIFDFPLEGQLDFERPSPAKS